MRGSVGLEHFLLLNGIDSGDSTDGGLVEFDGASGFGAFREDGFELGLKGTERLAQRVEIRGGKRFCHAGMLTRP